MGGRSGDLQNLSHIVFPTSRSGIPACPLLLEKSTGALREALLHSLQQVALSQQGFIKL